LSDVHSSSANPDLDDLGPAKMTE